MIPKHRSEPTKPQSAAQPMVCPKIPTSSQAEDKNPFWNHHSRIMLRQQLLKQNSDCCPYCFMRWPSPVLVDDEDDDSRPIRSWSESIRPGPPSQTGSQPSQTSSRLYRHSPSPSALSIFSSGRGPQAGRRSETPHSSSSNRYRIESIHNSSRRSSDGLNVAIAAGMATSSGALQANKNKPKVNQVHGLRVCCRAFVALQQPWDEVDEGQLPTTTVTHQIFQILIRVQPEHFDMPVQRWLDEQWPRQLPLPSTLDDPNTEQFLEQILRDKWSLRIVYKAAANKKPIQLPYFDLTTFKMKQLLSEESGLEHKKSCSEWKFDLIYTQPLLPRPERASTATPAPSRRKKGPKVKQEKHVEIDTTMFIGGKKRSRQPSSPELPVPETPSSDLPNIDELPGIVIRKEASVVQTIESDTASSSGDGMEDEEVHGVLQQNTDNEEEEDGPGSPQISPRDVEKQLAAEALASVGEQGTTLRLYEQSPPPASRTRHASSRRPVSKKARVE